MTTTEQGLSRRGFLKVIAVAGGGFSVGMLLDGCAHLTPAQSLGGGFHPNAWVRITPDDTITFFCDRAEMGQGVVTSHAMMLAEELEVDVSRITVTFAPADRDAYGIQLTGGSTSVTSQYDVIREAGATAREMLRRAAAKQWKVPLSEVTAQDGTITHAKMGSLKYGELATLAAKEDAPEVKLKDRKDFKTIGKPLRRIDAPAKSNGTAQFGIDTYLPGMLTAVVIRPPVVRGMLKSFDGAAAAKVKGVKAVLEIPHGVAVVADGYWPARKAARLVKAEWDLGDMAGFSSDKLRSVHLARTKTIGKKVTDEGDALDTLGASQKSITGLYEVPFLAHATMEPLNCTAHVKPDSVEIWTGTQSVSIAQEVAARITGLAHEKVKVTTVFLGGGFGRRSTADYVAEAVELSKRLNAPVKVVWSREDDMRHGHYRPASMALMRGSVDKDGMPEAWYGNFVTQSMISSFTDLAGVFAPEWVPRPLIALATGQMNKFLLQGHMTDPIASEGSSPVYKIPNVKVEVNQQETGVPVFPWRSVGHSINAFMVESFIDELAHLGGKDPFELRRTLLKDAPRNLAVLTKVAEAIGWGDKPAPGRFRGIAQHASFNSFCAHSIEVSVEGGGLRIHRVVSAVDCGQVVNPDIVAQQVESGVIYGLSAALRQRIDFVGGRVKQSNFNNYPLLRMHEAPSMETHIIPSDEKPTGIGEIAVPPVAPALTNALFAATGYRFRRLPLEEDLALVLAGRKPEEVKL